MTSTDPIVAVKDVEASSKWYQTIFKCRSAHGGVEFAVLVSKNDEILLCLHKWGDDKHPTMTKPNLTAGNGLILYFRTDNMNGIRENITAMNWPIEEDVHLNPNSKRLEFSFRDPDNYYITVTEFHKYEG